MTDLLAVPREPTLGSKVLLSVPPSVCCTCTLGRFMGKASVDICKHVFFRVIPVSTGGLCSGVGECGQLSHLLPAV